MLYYFLKNELTWQELWLCLLFVHEAFEKEKERSLEQAPKQTHSVNQDVHFDQWFQIFTVLKLKKSFIRKQSIFKMDFERNECFFLILWRKAAKLMNFKGFNAISDPIFDIQKRMLQNHLFIENQIFTSIEHRIFL